MCGTHMNFVAVDWTGLDCCLPPPLPWCLRRLVAQARARRSRRWWGRVAQTNGDGRPDRWQARVRPEPEPHVEAGGDRRQAAWGQRPSARPHHVGGHTPHVRACLRPRCMSIRYTVTRFEKWAITSYCTHKCTYLKYSFPWIWLAKAHLISNNLFSSDIFRYSEGYSCRLTVLTASWCVFTRNVLNMVE